MRNLLIMLAILVTGMVSAQRNPIDRTIEGTIFNVTQDGAENDLVISTEGTYRVIDGSFLDELYEHNSLSIPVQQLIDLVNPHYRGRVEVLSFETLAWRLQDRVDWMSVLDRYSLPRDLNGSIRILGEELGRFRNFILTLNTGASFAVTVNEDATGYTAALIGAHNIRLDQIVSYRGSDGICVEMEGRSYEVLKPGAYTVSSQGSNIRYTYDANLNVINVENNVPTACRN